MNFQIYKVMHTIARAITYIKVANVHQWFCIVHYSNVNYDHNQVRWTLPKHRSSVAPFNARFMKIADFGGKLLFV